MAERRPKEDDGNDQVIRSAPRHHSRGLQSDKSELRLERSLPNSDVVVCLEATPSACLDCLIPDHVLLQSIDAAIRRSLTGFGRSRFSRGASMAWLWTEGSPAAGAVTATVTERQVARSPRTS
jgi:hypothetical protein